MRARLAWQQLQNRRCGSQSTSTVQTYLGLAQADPSRPPYELTGAPYLSEQLPCPFRRFLSKRQQLAGRGRRTRDRREHLRDALELADNNRPAWLRLGCLLLDHAHISFHGRSSILVQASLS